MSTYITKERKELKEAWNNLINNEYFDPTAVRTEILESWKRSRDYSVDPYSIKPVLLSANSIQELLEEHMPLIKIVHPYMENLLQIVSAPSTYLVLSDKKGIVLDIVGDSKALEFCSKTSNLVVGADRSEKHAGTNAIGTSLALEKPIQVWDEEHFVSFHKNFCCSSAPIRDENGEIIGNLTLTCLSELGHIHTLGMVISAVDSISKELRILNAYSEINMYNAQLHSIIESFPYGVILLNKNNKVLQVNNNVVKMLNLHQSSTVGTIISNPIMTNSSALYSKDFLDAINNETYNKEVNLYINGPKMPPEKFTMTVKYVKMGNENFIGTVIIINNLDKINKVVSKFAGYKAAFNFSDIVATAEVSKEVIQTAKKAAKNDSNVLILGNSGTGKELIAQSIHNASSVSSGPFVAINCGALPKGLIESELFGYEKGSFTGANKDGNPGKFELADGGTIFLDEIGDMPLDVQVSLLRVLQNKEVVRIGAKYPKPINIRIIAATNVDLYKAVENSTFRADLYYRLNVFTINIPPLKERVEDIEALSNSFVKKYNENKNTSFKISPNVYLYLKNYPWPGNIRELENVIERALNLAENNIITEHDLSTEILEYSQILLKDKLSFPSNDETFQQSNDLNEEVSFKSNSPISFEPATDTQNFPQSDHQGNSFPTKKIDDVEHQMILKALEETNGNVKFAATLLGISRRTLYRKFEKYNISVAKFK